MKKVKPIILLLLAILFFTIAIPIIINEAYKLGAGYITKWDAADVLAYYGTILGATATTTAMVVTITFTHKQIRRDSYIKSESDKWAKIESVLADALDNINPIRPIKQIMDTGSTDPSAYIRIIQKYQISCHTATDQLNAYLNIVDYPKVKPIIDAIGSLLEEIDQIFQDEITEYSKLCDLKGKSTAKKTIEMENNYPGSFSKEDLAFSEKVIKDTNGIQYEDIMKTIEQLNKKIIAVYHGTYRSLLQLKGSTFEIINTEVQKNAANILCLWRRK